MLGFGALGISGNSIFKATQNPTLIVEDRIQKAFFGS
jgi:hypothetical protein